MRIVNTEVASNSQISSSDPIAWLMEGDPSIRWQVLSDLIGAERSVVEAEQRRVAESGWGAQLLSCQEPSGMWGGGVYSPKWISTTYTLLTLRFLGLPAGHPQAVAGCELLLERSFYRDGGINVAASHKQSEPCVTGMVLSILSHFRIADERVDRIAVHLLGRQMADGGWNCQDYRGATHASFHTTLLVLEGLLEYQRSSQEQGIHEAEIEKIQSAQGRAHEFLLEHRLFRSHRTGEVVDPRMLRFPFPPRWHHDVLRALDYFRRFSITWTGNNPRGRFINTGKHEFDERFSDAISVVHRKRSPDGRWPAYRGPAGKEYFEMERPGVPGRWNTLRALRVLAWWENGR
jgi:hypothetical protein